jgi:hypothetical protein
MKEIKKCYIIPKNLFKKPIKSEVAVVKQKPYQYLSEPNLT